MEDIEKLTNENQLLRDALSSVVSTAEQLMPDHIVSYSDGREILHNTMVFRVKDATACRKALDKAHKLLA